MPSLPVAEETELWELEDDLSSVACHAAIELDNLILGRTTDLKEVQRLIHTIADVIPTVQEPSSTAPMLKNATTVVLIKRALHDSHPGTSVTKVDELVTHAKQIAESLDQLVINPHAFTEKQPDELLRMRSFHAYPVDTSQPPAAALGCSQEPAYSFSYVGPSICTAIPSKLRTSSK